MPQYFDSVRDMYRSHYCEGDSTNSSTCWLIDSHGLHSKFRLPFLGVDDWCKLTIRQIKSIVIIVYSEGFAMRL